MDTLRNKYIELMNQLTKRKEFKGGADFSGIVFMIQTNVSPVGVREQLKREGYLAKVVKGCLWFTDKDHAEDLDFYINQENNPSDSND